MRKTLFIIILSCVVFANPYFEQVDKAQQYGINRVKETGAMVDLFWNPERDKKILDRNEAAKPKTAEQCAIYAFQTEWCTLTYPKEKQLYIDKIKCEVYAPGCIVAEDNLYCEKYEKHKCARFVKEPK